MKLAPFFKIVMFLHFFLLWKKVSFTQLFLTVIWMRLINKWRRMDSLCHLKLFIYWWNLLEQWKKYWEFLIAWYFGRNCPILVADRNRIDADWVWVIDHDHFFNAKLLVNSYERNHCIVVIRKRIHGRISVAPKVSFFTLPLGTPILPPSRSSLLPVTNVQCGKPPV